MHALLTRYQRAVDLAVLQVRLKGKNIWNFGHDGSGSVAGVLFIMFLLVWSPSENVDWLFLNWLTLAKFPSIFPS
jgi:hypothetical protein